MPNYQQGKVYKLVGGGKTYIGSTCQDLANRKAQHIRAWKADDKHKSTSTQLLDLTNGVVDIVLIEDVPVNRREELLRRERYWIENMECVNKIVPFRSKEEVKQYFKEYQQMEVQSGKIKERYWKNVEKNRTRARQYGAKNKEVISQRRKARRLENLEEMKLKELERSRKFREEHKGETISCGCGSVVSRFAVRRHERTQKHRKWGEEQTKV